LQDDNIAKTLQNVIAILI